MTNQRLQRQIAREAACLLFWRQETEYFRAKLRAARRLRGGLIRSDELPTNGQVETQLQRIADQFHRLRPGSPLRDRYQFALDRMQGLADFHPRVLVRGLNCRVSPRDGTLLARDNICVQAFADRTSDVLERLRAVGWRVDGQFDRLSRGPVHEGQAADCRLARLGFNDRYCWQLDIYPRHLAQRVVRSRRTGKRVWRWSVRELSERLALPAWDGLARESTAVATVPLDRFVLYRGLLMPLENVRQNVREHPEGDALYHSLQVFQLAREEIAYDEEFLLACLMHDVGQAIDPADPVSATLAALDGSITERTAWLIAHHPQAQAAFTGELGQRALRRLKQSENYDELMLMARCDRRGRQRGVMVPDVDEAIDYLRDLSNSNG